MTGSGTPRGASTWISSRGTGRRSLATPIRSSWRCSEMPPRLPGPWGRGSLIRRAPGFWLSWTAFSPKGARSFPTVVPRRWKPRSSSCSPCARGESACWLCGVPFTGARWALWGSPSTRSTGNPGRISSVPWNTGLPKRCSRRWGRTWRRSSWNPSGRRGGVPPGPGFWSGPLCPVPTNGNTLGGRRDPVRLGAVRRGVGER